MGWDEISNSVCPIARALALVGDRWTMLILLELARGVHRFEELQAQTGMSSHLLSTRLKRMEEDGLVERRPYSERPPRFEYHSTEKGQGLDPVLVLLANWGRTWQGDKPSERATSLRHKDSGEAVDDVFALPGSLKDFRYRRFEMVPSKAFAAERQQRRERFFAKDGKAAIKP